MTCSLPSGDLCSAMLWLCHARNRHLINSSTKTVPTQCSSYYAYSTKRYAVMLTVVEQCLTWNFDSWLNITRALNWLSTWLSDITLQINRSKISKTSLRRWPFQALRVSQFTQVNLWLKRNYFSINRDFFLQSIGFYIKSFVPATVLTTEAVFVVSYRHIGQTCWKYTINIFTTKTLQMKKLK